jgi:hypothetical protein
MTSRSTLTTALTVTLAAMIGATTLLGATLARAQDDCPYKYYLPAAANGPGAFGSYWKTTLQGRNVGLETAFAYMVAHLRGQPPGELDPVSQPFALGPSVSFDYDDVVAQAFAMQNAAVSIDICATQPLAFGVSNTYNRSSDGARQGTAYPVFDRATMASDQRLLHRGDSTEIRLMGEENGKRENWILYNAEDSQELIAHLTLLDSNGNMKTTNWHIVPAHTYIQFSPLGRALNGDDNVVNPGDTLQITIDRSTPGEGDVLAYSIISQVDTINQEKQDPITLEGTITRLVEEARFDILPKAIEVNDDYVKHINIKTTPGSLITDVYIDYNNDGTFDTHFDDTDTNNFEWTIPTYAVGAGTANPRVRAFILHNGVIYNKDFNGNTHTITPEQNGYIATYNDAKAFIMGNLNLASTWASHGLAGGWATKPSDWIAGWPLYFNGVNNPPNDPELDHLKFNDQGNEITGNVMQLYCIDGSVLGVGGMPEAEFDQFRRVVKATLP